MAKSATKRMEAARAVTQRVVNREILAAAIFSRVWPSHLARPRVEQVNFPFVVCIHSPAGQLAWRVHQDELPLFAHLKEAPNDGQDYTADDKRVRMLHLATEGW